MRASMWCSAALALGLVLAVVSLAQAQTSTTAVTQLVDEGLRLRTKGRDAEALDRFEAAYVLQREPRTLAQIALAEQALGRWAAAHGHLTEALSHRDDAWISQWRGQLEATLAKLEAEFGSFEVVSNVPGATVSIGDRVIGTTPLSRRQVMPGIFTVHVQAAAHEPLAQTVRVARGQHSRVSVELTPSAPPAAPALQPPVEPAPSAPAAPMQAAVQPRAAQPAPRPAIPTAGPQRAASTARAPRRGLSTRGRALLAVAGVGTAVALASAVTYKVAAKKADQLDATCYVDVCTASERSARRSTVRTLDRTSRVLLAAGGATLVASGLAFLLGLAGKWEPAAPEATLSAAVDRASAVLYGTLEF